MIDRLTSKRVVLVLVLLSASVILVSGSREWVQGSVGDAALGASTLHGKGSDIAPGALAAALVGLASAVAAATSGRVVRVIAACSALLAAALGTAVVISVLADPGGALRVLAAAGTGRSGTVVTDGQVGVWAWVALAASAVMGLGALGALVGSSRWHGLSSRYDAPVTSESSSTTSTSKSSQPGQSSPTSPSGPALDRRGRRESDWDQLSRGEDPTAGL